MICECHSCVILELEKKNSRVSPINASNLINTCIIVSMHSHIYKHTCKRVYFYFKLKLRHSENKKITFFCDINYINRLTRDCKIAESDYKGWTDSSLWNMLRDLCELDCALLAFYIWLLHLDERGKSYVFQLVRLILLAKRVNSYNRTNNEWESTYYCYSEDSQYIIFLTARNFMKL